MRAGKRLGIAILAGGLVLGSSHVAAQSAPVATTNTPATDAVGPKELQNFSLSGTVTKVADQPAQTAAPTNTSRAAKAPRTSSASTDLTTRADRRAAQAAPQSPSAVRTASNEAAQPSAPMPEPSLQTPVAAALPPPQTSAVQPSSSGAPLPTAAGLAPEAESATGTQAAQSALLLWPWLLAAAALGGGGLFLFWRNRSRQPFPAGPQFDLFAAPEPAPRPTPVPQPRAPGPAPAPTAPRASTAGGVVSTALRPWIEVAMHPLRCIVEEAEVRFEFELDLFNSGNAPARAVLVEASVFNAGPNQEQDIGAFFARPASEADRIDSIPPLQRMTLRTEVIAPRPNVQVLEIAGRQVFVPLIAFNALYRRTGGDGQTSVAYLLGRDTTGEKMAPFRLDLGPRVFRGVGVRLLPIGVRT